MESSKMILAKYLFEFTDSNSESSSSESDDEEFLALASTELAKKRIKIDKYVSNVVEKYLESDFQAHFRIKRSSVQALLDKLQMNSVDCSGRPKAPLKEALLLTIWAVSNQECFRSIGDRFGVSKGHAHRLFLETCRLISTLLRQYIVWPTESDAEQTVAEFNCLRGSSSFPGVFGCVDGTHIPIPGPLHDNSYYNRKGYHSMILQCICNARQEFININFGWPGSVNDARVWAECSINKILLEDPLKLLPPRTHLLGDSAYPLRRFLLVPFRDNGHLTYNQKKFNKRLSSTRVVIEQAFGRLKGQFRRLKYINVMKLENAKFIVNTACILHNISIGDGTVIDSTESSENSDGDIPEINDDDFHSTDESGAQYRQMVMHSLAC